MSTIDLFRKLTLTEVSQKLQLKPFDIARIMGQNGGLPDVLLFSDELVDQIRKLAGVEVWWDADPLPIEDENRSRALVRTLSQKLQAHEKDGGGSTRADKIQSCQNPERATQITSSIQLAQLATLQNGFHCEH